jgi:hypothetical protein
MTYVQTLIADFMVHPFAYTMGTLTALATMLKKFAPKLRITRALNALASDVPELTTIALSFASKKSLLKALELSGHVINDVIEATEEPLSFDLKQKKVIPAPLQKRDEALEKIKTTLEQLLASLNEKK